MATVTLINKTNRAKVINLDHPAFRDKKYGFERKPVQVSVTNKDGQTGTAIENRSIIGSLYLPAGGSLEGLHPAIKNCSQIRSMIMNGEVEVKDSGNTEPESAGQAVQSGRPRGTRRALTENNNG